MAKSSEDKPKTLTRTFTQPPDTIQYIANVNDTLEKIAAHFDTTPSELVKTNRLSCRLIFPGQLLFVPKKKQTAENDKDSDVSSPSSKPAAHARGSSSSEELSPTEADKDCYERFLKISTRYITDGKGVVSGILLVTPNCIMFDPNVSDPLVIEHGSDMYRVSAPFSLILKAAMFHDIALMKLKSTPNNDDQDKSIHSVYHPSPKEEATTQDPSQEGGDGTVKKEEESQQLSLDCGDAFHLKENMAKDAQPSCSEEGEKQSSDRTSFSTLVNNILDDKVLEDLKKLIPRPSQPINDAPLFLCLRMGRAIKPLPLASEPKTRVHREYWFSIPREKVDCLYNFFLKWAPETYGELDDYDAAARNLVPIDKSDDESETEFEFVPPIEHKKAAKKHAGGFTRLRFFSESDVSKTLPAKFANRHETLSLHPSSPSSKKEFEIPELVDPSEILDFDSLKLLYLHFPPSTIGNQMKLFYGTSKNGFSLKTLYRSMKTDYDGPILLVIQDSENHVFGALSSSPFHCSDLFYGTGETFLYTFYPTFKVFKWTGENTNFIHGEPNNLAIGAGQGIFGLWLDGDLYHGRTQPCLTFGNPILTSKEDFVVKAIEVWGFV